MLISARDELVVGPPEQGHEPGRACGYHGPAGVVRVEDTQRPDVFDGPSYLGPAGADGMVTMPVKPYAVIPAVLLAVFPGGRA